MFAFLFKFTNCQGEIIHKPDFSRGIGPTHRHCTNNRVVGGWCKRLVTFLPPEPGAKALW